MAIDFPSSPTPGQTYTYSGKAWTWDGYAWRSAGSVGPQGTSGYSGAVGTSGFSGYSGGNPSIGKQTIWIPAGAMTARTTNGPSSGLVETSTNKVMMATLDFDTTTTEYAQFSVAMPKSWNESTVSARFYWSHPATTVNFGVLWVIQALALTDGETIDTAYATQTEVADTGGSTNFLYRSSESGSITIDSSASVEDLIVFQIYRWTANTSDTLGVDARLHGVMLYYTTDAVNDA